MSTDAIQKNLAEIENWMQTSADPSTLLTNEDFMAQVVPIMNYTLYLLRLGSALAPNEEAARRGYTKRKAIIVGHLIRIAKLYEGLLIHVAKRQLELAAIFIRLISETMVRMRYLMRAKNSSFHSFVLSSYKPEREILLDLESKAANRPLIQIERRMRRKIRSRLKKDRIAIRDFVSNKNWNLDGKNFRTLLNEIGWSEDVYAYVFGSSSHAVHGDWYDISVHHIQRKGRYYLPDLDYDDPDPRISCPVTHICLEVLYDYMKWHKLDPDNGILPIILRLKEVNRLVDTAHENAMGE